MELREVVHETDRCPECGAILGAPINMRERDSTAFTAMRSYETSLPPRWRPRATCWRGHQWEASECVAHGHGGWTFRYTNLERIG